MDRRVDKDVAELYKLVLKFKVRVDYIPRAWYKVHQTNRGIDPEYQIPAVPGYVKMAMRYGKDG